MEIKIWLSEKIELHNWRRLQDFAQKMANRLIQGQVRYGKPRVEANYLTRLTREVVAYRHTGNAEHLINVANYAWLETQAPEHAKFHFDSSVGSVTRGKGIEKGK